MSLVLVTGGRDYDDRELVFRVLDIVATQLPRLQILHGACGWDADVGPFLPKHLKGADKWADQWAYENGRPVRREPAYWKRFGNKAGPIRNGKMLGQNPHLVVVFPGGKGTENMKRIATNARFTVTTPDTWIPSKKFSLEPSS